MFSWLKQVMARRRAAREQAAKALLAERQAAVMALAHPRRAGQLVLVPPGMPLQDLLREAQELVAQERQTLSHGSPRSTARSGKTAKRSTSRRRRAR
jgi:hypothetical protein